MTTYSPDLALPNAPRFNYSMSHGEELQINIDTEPLASSYATEAALGIPAPTVAKIDAGDHEFSVLDMRSHNRFTTPLLVVDTSFLSFDAVKGYKGIWLGRPLTFGREHLTDRFEYLPTVSREHFSLAYNGLALAIRNLFPTNPTLLSGDIIGAPDENAFNDNIRAFFTAAAKGDVEDRHDFGSADQEAPYGYYKNHPIIGRKSVSVKNGVYFTTQPDSEAVVVDDKSKVLRRISDKLLTNLKSMYGAETTVDVAKVLKKVNELTIDAMPYDENKSNELSWPLYDGNQLIGLSEYVQAGCGVCRHQCLLAAYLAESLVENGLITGQVGVERNHDVDAHGAHAWAVFKTPDGQTIVIDPAQEFVGTKQQARKERRWKYELPVET